MFCRRNALILHLAYRGRFHGGGRNTPALHTDRLVHQVAEARRILLAHAIKGGIGWDIYLLLGVDIRSFTIAPVSVHSQH